MSILRGGETLSLNSEEITSLWDYEEQLFNLQDKSRMKEVHSLCKQRSIRIYLTSIVQANGLLELRRSPRTRTFEARTNECLNGVHFLLTGRAY